MPREALALWPGMVVREQVVSVVPLEVSELQA